MLRHIFAKSAAEIQEFPAFRNQLVPHAPQEFYQSIPALPEVTPQYRHQSGIKRGSSSSARFFAGISSDKFYLLVPGDRVPH